MSQSRPPRVVYRCSFCGKSKEQVHRLIAGPGGVYICNECVAFCQGILDEGHVGGEALASDQPTVLQVKLLWTVGRVSTQLEHLRADMHNLATEMSALAEQLRAYDDRASTVSEEEE
jgi:hypothetical protein